MYLIDYPQYVAGQNIEYIDKKTKYNYKPIFFYNVYNLKLFII